MRALARAWGTKVMVGTVLTAGLLALPIAYWSWRNAGQSPAPSFAAGHPLTQVTLKVDGMTCPTCSYRVRKALVDLPGITKAEVSLEKGQAVVEYEEGKATVEQMIEAIKGAGYSAKPIGAGGQGR